MANTPSSTNTPAPAPRRRVPAILRDCPTCGAVAGECCEGVTYYHHRRKYPTGGRPQSR